MACRGPATKQQAHQLDRKAKRPSRAVRLDAGAPLLPSPRRGRPFQRGVLVSMSELANADGRGFEAVERGSIHLFGVDDDSEFDQGFVSERGGRKPTRQLRKIATKIRGDNHNEAGRGFSDGRLDRRLDILRLDRTARA